MRDWTKADGVKYAKDLPGVGSFNWVVVKIINQTGDHERWNGVKRMGVLLHDGSWTMEGMYLEAGEFTVIDKDPMGIKEKVTIDLKQFNNLGLTQLEYVKQHIETLIKKLEG